MGSSPEGEDPITLGTIFSQKEFTVTTLKFDSYSFM